MSTAETKILTTFQTKNAQARRTSSFGIFTSLRPILLASGTGTTEYLKKIFEVNMLNK
jgi:hypothetical protein